MRLALEEAGTQLPRCGGPPGGAGRRRTRHFESARGPRRPPFAPYVEIFNTHHPLGDGYAYEEQKAEAKRRTRDFLAVRLPKFLGYFERVLELNDSRGPWLVGARLSYADLSMAQVSTRVSDTPSCQPAAGRFVVFRLPSLLDRSLSRPSAEVL